MGAFSIWHWVIVLVVVLILFGGKGKISSLMGDFGKGLKNFKDHVKSNKETNEEDVISEIPESKSNTSKKKKTSKTIKKKQTIKKKS
jgi:sec-independent protein translocase protein TatA